MNSLNEALRLFEATEANLAKLESLWNGIKNLIPGGVAFGDTTDGAYDNHCRAFRDVQHGLPKIDGWELPVCLLELDEIAQMRLDADFIGEPDCFARTEASIFEQEKYLQDYRYRLNKKRRQLVRTQMLATVDHVDACFRELLLAYPEDYERTQEAVEESAWEDLKHGITTIDQLLGSTSRPQRWSDLQRCLHFGLVADLHAIKNLDWPAVKTGIVRTLYGESDPIPVGIEDLEILVTSNPIGDVITKLKWDSLSAEGFERLLFSLISNTTGYENPEWLTETNASDRGRDLSVVHVVEDALQGTQRRRVLIQCKHWMSKSIGLKDVSTTREQMKLWEPPKVDTLVIASSGRFTTDAIQYIEKNNQSDTGLCIQMWAESHLERLLASRPALIGEFGLR